jgi:DNA-binding NarL/FixJ family response regulator
MAISLVIADDHYAIWDAVVTWLAKSGAFEVKAQVPDGIKALQACVIYKPNLLLLDINMPGLNGLQVLRGLRKISFPPKTIVYAADDSYEMAAECLKTGAKGYVVKSSPRQVLMQAVRKVLQNQIYIDPLISAQTIDLLQKSESSLITGNSVISPVVEVAENLGEGNTVTLTKREIEILQLMATGNVKTAEIAKILFLSPHTVNNHITSAFRKLQVNTRIEALVEAKRRGLIQV